MPRKIPRSSQNKKAQMSRRKFIESHGADCVNWQWSWSFINKAEKFVIFGAWDRDTEGKKSRIFCETWEFDHKKKRKAAYGQSREHVRLVEEENYRLFTFPMKFSDARKDSENRGPAKIGGFTPKLTERKILRVGHTWYATTASDDFATPEESDLDAFPEGGRTRVVVNAYERSRGARKKCLAHHGYHCKVCRVLLLDLYGEIGRNFIHVHHIRPIGGMGKAYEVHAVRDLVPVCPNCHAMLHQTSPPLSVEQLQNQMASVGKAGSVV